MRHDHVPLELSETWVEYWLLQQEGGIIKMTYDELTKQDVKWVDDMALIANLVAEYKESQNQLNNGSKRGATLGSLESSIKS